MNQIIVKHMLADKNKMKNAIEGFSNTFQKYKITLCEMDIDTTNSSLLKTKIVGEDREHVEKFLKSNGFRMNLHSNLKSRFEIVFESNGKVA